MVRPLLHAPLLRAPDLVARRRDGTEESDLRPSGIFAWLTRPWVRRAILTPAALLSCTGPTMSDAPAPPIAEILHADSFEGVGRR
ncbi:MAG: hypothetical protein IT384_10030 [Deltaproteobacteria bacterium]|nr:hypothetical protein [Deltaproteobacteria bacterium]